MNAEIFKYALHNNIPAGIRKAKRQRAIRKAIGIGLLAIAASIFAYLIV